MTALTTLTAAQRKALAYLAQVEMAWRGPRPLTKQMARALVRRGLAEWAKFNSFRITDAGRAALAAEPTR